jgi:hypothetical protein
LLIRLTFILFQRPRKIEYRCKSFYAGVIPRNILSSCAALPTGPMIEIPSDAPPEVKAELAAIQAEYKVRLTNVAVYKRHEAVLAPILQVFLR